MNEQTRKKGHETILEFVKTLPGMPGVYRMMNAAGEALYVGKAKSLKKRVMAYTTPQKHPIRLQRMIAATASMEFTTTHTEAEALLLEANLIKKLKPRYNILLRDDKSFPFIQITGGHDFPQLSKHRGAKDEVGEYFGPYASGYAVNESLEVLQRAFQLRTCSDSIFSGRTRPCLQFQIKRCSAPCVGKVSREQYQLQVELARAFLSGKSRDIQDQFVSAMQRASEEMDFEAAALFRDRIRILTSIQRHQTINIEGIESADFHVIHQDKGETCIQVFFFRSGQNYGNRSYFPRHDAEETPGDILFAFLAQFYTNKPVPKEIYVNHDLSDLMVMEEALRMKAGSKVTIQNPTRGPKKEIIDMAAKNAREALARRMAVEASQAEIFNRLAEVFGLEGPPERIEVFDNSHISGSHAVGAMIVASAEGWVKNSYRKFNIRGPVAPGDDYAMMKEVLTRRFQGLLKDGAEGVWPDLLVIDGGQGQLTATLTVMRELGIDDVPVVSIAKGPDRNAGRERYFMEGKEPITLNQGDAVHYFMQRIRDEAHRFAITTHRARRSKAIGENPLDAIPGIGGKRKKALLLHFGSAKAVAQAGVADLQKVAGISKAVAEKIYGFFHEKAE
ncbi:MAG TPA: excinuclease ABC subunit UvrC [Patescibacteria group bacterium]|nr:excinuclease ABC subunit UvrC [Patescibacteria group bacterium]